MPSFYGLKILTVLFFYLRMNGGGVLEQFLKLLSIYLGAKHSFKVSS